LSKKTYLLNNLREGISKKRNPCPKEAVNLNFTLLNFPKGTLFNRACKILSNYKKTNPGKAVKG
jgi:hypothetical protein